MIPLHSEMIVEVENTLFDVEAKKDLGQPTGWKKDDYGINLSFFLKWEEAICVKTKLFRI